MVIISMYKISIIVPVYKVEEYLDRCVKSLQNQTYSNIEIILVDDGSPDRCGELCDSYAIGDSKVKVIHKENGGLSDARNVGILESSGDYLLFVDSDDYIELSACEKFMNLIGSKDVDVAMGDVLRIINGKEYEMSFNNSDIGMIQSGKKFLKNQLKSNSMNVASCRNMYKRDFLIKNSLFFLKGILHEDEEWLPRVLLSANKVMPTGINFYRYIIREDSITQKKDKKKNALDLLKICYSLENLYSTLLDVELKGLLNEYLLKLYLNAVYTGKLHETNSVKYLNDSFLKGKAKSLKCKIQVAIYRSNRNIYYRIYDILS